MPQSTELPVLTDSLLAIQSAWGGCTRCDLHVNRSVGATTYCKAGPPRPDVLFVIDRTDPCLLRDRQFPSGNYAEVLRTLMGKFGETSSHYWLTPAVLCPTTVPDPSDWRPLELMATPNKQQVSSCRPRLHEEIRTLCPEVIVAFGKMAMEAVFPKNPPSWMTVLGDIVEPKIAGGMSPLVIPCMVTYSLSHLYRNWDLSAGGLWNTVFDHVQQAALIAEYLRELRGDISD